MKNLIAIILAAMFAAVSFQAVAQEKKAAAAKAPTKAQCEKDMKIKGCDEVMKMEKKK